ncbi:YmiA family putative membrane protein [Mangrovibacter phragmitis]|nr:MULTISPECIES: YmiA family putative membrane protein [Mangrovibacter]
MRTAMSSGKQSPRSPVSAKRKAWLAAFAVSAVFWVAVILLVLKYW